MVTDKTIKIKRSKEERRLFDYAERKFRSAIMLYLLQQDTAELSCMTFTSHDQRILYLCLHMVYLDQMHIHNRQTTVSVDDWRQCESAWADFYRTDPNLYSAVQSIEAMVEHWPNEQFTFNSRGTAYSIKIGNGQEPMSEMTISLKPENGFTYTSGFMSQYFKTKYIDANHSARSAIEQREGM